MNTIDTLPNSESFAAAVAQHQELCDAMAGLESIDDDIKRGELADIGPYIGLTDSELAEALAGHYKCPEMANTKWINQVLSGKRLSKDNPFKTVSASDHAKKSLITYHTANNMWLRSAQLSADHFEDYVTARFLLDHEDHKLINSIMDDPETLSDIADTGMAANIVIGRPTLEWLSITIRTIRVNIYQDGEMIGSISADLTTASESVSNADFWYAFDADSYGMARVADDILSEYFYRGRPSSNDIESAGDLLINPISDAENALVVIHGIYLRPGYCESILIKGILDTLSMAIDRHYEYLGIDKISLVAVNMACCIPERKGIQSDIQRFEQAKRDVAVLSYAFDDYVRLPEDFSGIDRPDVFIVNADLERPKGTTDWGFFPNE